jgi:hypothetical protein
VNDDPKRSFDSPDDLTRRQWILRLGEFVALAGVSGLAPEVAAVFAAQLAEQSKLKALPPGLYEPSQDHLVHVLSSSGKKWTPPAGAETEFALPTAVADQPQFFEADDFKAVTRIIEVLLGKVDSAASLEAARWFDLLMTASKADAGTEERKFFELIRREAIRGYFTSAEGLKELDYRGNAYYGECPGC